MFTLAPRVHPRRPSARRRPLSSARRARRPLVHRRGIAGIDREWLYRIRTGVRIVERLAAVEAFVPGTVQMVLDDVPIRPPMVFPAMASNELVPPATNAVPLPVAATPTRHAAPVAADVSPEDHPPRRR